MAAWRNIRREWLHARDRSRVRVIGNRQVRLDLNLQEVDVRVSRVMQMQVCLSYASMAGIFIQASLYGLLQSQGSNSRYQGWLVGEQAWMIDIFCAGKTP